MAAYDPHANGEMWSSGSDPAKVVAQSNAFLQAVADREEDPLERMDAITLAWDTTLDGLGGDHGLVLAALRVFQGECRDAELSRATTTERQLWLRVTPHVWAAIIYHRLGYARKALSHAYTALMELERFAGGETIVFEALGSTTPTVIGELAVATTTILGASMRRVTFAEGSKTHEQLVGRCRRLYGAYALHGRDPVIYPRTPAMATQLLLLFAEQRNPDDKPIIEALYLLDEATRPRDVRGQATVRLRDHAYTLYNGDTTGAAIIAKTALDPIRSFPLPRHETRITQLELLA